MNEAVSGIAVVETGGLLAAAVRAGGGTVGVASACPSLIWDGGGAAELAAFLTSNPQVTWVQLCSAGVEEFLPLIETTRTWTRISDAFGPQVAEHALALLLALSRHLQLYARRREWGPEPDAPMLFDSNIMIVGAGSIAECLIPLLAPFRSKIYIVRRRPDPMPGAAETIRPDRIVEYLPTMDAVVLAAPLTPHTRGMIGHAELRAMAPSAILVNVARGGLVETRDLVKALRAGEIAGAGLDVTDPEPLPTGHDLWALDNCLITPHVANPAGAQASSTARTVTENVRRRLQGRPLLGVIDHELGY